MTASTTGRFAVMVFLWLTMSAAPAIAKTVWVSNAADSGPATLRAAIGEANADSDIDTIVIRHVKRPIKLSEPICFRGAQALSIEGGGSTITSGGARDLFVADGGGDLRFANIKFSGAPETALTVNVPVDRTGEQGVVLYNTTLDGNGHYGLHFDDQAEGDGAGADSPASLRLVVIKSVVTNNNHESLAPDADDKDGIRVDEGGVGGIVVNVVATRMNGNRAEGIELDEKGPGDAYLTASDSHFDENGTQPQNTEDLEDGLDVDEADGGDLVVVLNNVTVNGNSDEGVDLDEAGAGSTYLFAANLVASGNTDEGIKLSEDADVEETPDESDGDGHLVANLSRIVVDGNGDDGIRLEEFGVGDVTVNVTSADVTNSGKAGLRIVQEAAGDGKLFADDLAGGGNGDRDLKTDGVTIVRQ